MALNLEGKLQDANQRLAEQAAAKRTPLIIPKMESPEPEEPPTPEEDRKAEEELTKDLKKLTSSETEKEKKPRKKRQTLGRTNQIKARVTDEELVRFQKRVKKAGISQGEFIRKAVLTGKVEIIEQSPITIEFLDELAQLRAEMGRQGGLLKMIIKPNEEQKKLQPLEWKLLTENIREMEATRKRLSELEVKICGDYKTSNQQER